MDQAFIDKFTPFGGSHAWITHAVLVLVVALLANFLQKRLLRRLEDRFARTANLWDDAVLAALKKPLSVLIWVLGVTFSLQILADQAKPVVLNYIVSLRDIGVVACITWFLLRLTQEARDSMLAQRQAAGQAVDATTVSAVVKLTRISIMIIATLVMLQTLGYSVSGVLAFGGIGGVVVGFAAKDLLANFFGGLMIYLDRPFAVGDKIRSPERDMEGTVEEIGWRLTRIRTLEYRPLYVPNSVFTTIAVENISRMSHRRIRETIGLRYEDAGKIPAIVAAVKEMLLNHPQIDQTLLLMVNFAQFGASSLDLSIDACVRDVTAEVFPDIRQEILLRIHQIVVSQGADFAYPTSTVHIPQPVTVSDTGKTSAH